MILGTLLLLGVRQLAIRGKVVLFLVVGMV